MSVFGDFRNVWDQRFPGSDLPAAWEEDVRANLTKHKQKVAELREELEKEEFYVEYLERLLIDVAEHRACNKSEGERSSIVSDKEKSATDKSDSNVQVGGEDKKSSGKDVSKENKSIISDHALKGVNRDSVLQCVSELSASSSDSRIVRSRSDVPEKISAVNKALENRRARCNTHPNISNYVTVIEVNGTGKSEGQKNVGENKPEVTKKIPPRPPPKKPNKLKSASSFSSADIEYGSSSSLDKLSDEKSTQNKSSPENKEVSSEESKEISGEVELRSVAKECEAHVAALAKTSPTTSAATPTILAASPVTPTAPTEGISTATTPTTPTEATAGEGGTQDGNSGKECDLENSTSPSETKAATERTSTQDIPEEEEPYYDSVALDGEYVYLQTGGTASSTMTSGTSSGLTDADMAEIAAMTLPSSSPLSQSQFELQTNAPSSPDKQSNYVNIDYFLKLQLNAALRDGLPFAASFNFLQHSTVDTRSSSVESEDESEVPPLLRTISMETDQTDDVISNLSEGTYASNSSLDSASHILGRKSSLSPEASKAEAERITMYKCIISSIIESETIYLECLNVMLQYMKALKATLATSQPVITEDEFNTIFYKVPDLHALHSKFLDGLKKRSQNWDGRLTIGDHFRIMASNINIYGAFLHNYVRATETVKKCCSNNQQFAEITSNIHLKCMAGQKLSLEDLLHKPVARVQKNALVLHDLLKYTPESHPDHKTLNDALKMTQNFLDEFNMIHTKTMFPSADRAQRRLVKNSFIVELSDGHRKLRHLFLFNDVIACAKYKASGRDKFTFELKWYIPLKDIVIFEEPVTEPREVSPVNIVALKSQACTVRDQILWDERNDDKRARLSSRSEKQRKKLADLEAQLVLASPNLVFRVGNRSARTYIFFLSSEFERTQWIDAIHALQSCELPSPNVTVSMYELQAWITACRNFLKTNMGSYLLRTGRDESLLVGDLHITLKDLHGLEQPADLFVCLEVDSYGHYFRKAKTKLVCNSSKPHWNEDFIIELEGSQNLRILLYEESQERAILRGKNTVMLSRSWLSDQRVDKSIQLQNTSLHISLKFVPSEVTLRRVPTAKASGLFGAKIQQVCKRQKRTVPFIISSCVREVERRGMNEVGIYRVSGSATDVNRLKKSFETNSYEAEQLLKEVDIHSVTGILKLYLRELPEALFTDELYPKFLEAFNTGSSSDGGKQRALQSCFLALPQQNQEIINFLLDHLIKVNQHENHNKMSMHNLATVFGPTLLRPGSAKSESSKQRDLLAASTVDVMAQAGILYYFLQGKAVAHS